MPNVFVAWSIVVGIILVVHATVTLCQLLERPMGWVVAVLSEGTVKAFRPLLSVSPCRLVLVVWVRRWRRSVAGVDAGMGGV